jgi:L-ascorbate metabolism protein UlaG (beta-lactamase superfamily)
MYHKIRFFNTLESIQKEEKMCVQKHLGRKGRFEMANKVNLRLCLAIIVFLQMIAGLAQAATITVGPEASYDFNTIQAGIDAAVDGDTVLVAPAEYEITVPISFQGKAITVKSEAGPDETTIRMGTSADTDLCSVVVFENNETSASVLDGFTITDGKGSGPQNASAGGGIYFGSSSGTVRDCAIIQNTATYGGGVICWDNSFVTLSDCIIEDNSVTGYGGGVFSVQNSSVTMTDCIICGNSVTGAITARAGYGGGVSCTENSIVTLTNCMIADNSAGMGGGGAYFAKTNTASNIANCIITGNSAGNWGAGVGCEVNEIPLAMTNCVIARNRAGEGIGGVACTLGAGATISNCTIWDNSGGSIWGASGLGCWKGSATVTNSIIWANISPKGREISVEDVASTLTITYSDIAGGGAAVYVDGGTLNWGTGNIDADPLLADIGHWADVNDPNIIVEPNDPNAVWIDGDYHLKSEGGRLDQVSKSWIVDDVTSPCIDAGDPNSPVGDEPEPNGGRINMGVYGGTAEASMSPTEAEEIVNVQWLGHSTVKVWTEDCIVYVDPERVPESLHDATLVCVTHAHGDHYSPSDIAKVSNSDTQFVAPPDVVQLYGSGQAIAPGQIIEFDFVTIKAVPAYNINKTNHPKSNNWVGYIIELGGKRIYVAGDTDLIEEMKTLGDIDVAFLPAGGTYTMNATEAAEATGYIKPDLAIPYHWGQSVGTLADAQRFVELAQCPAMVMAVGEMISSDNWPEYSPLIAHWALDEAEGDIAHDSAGENHGTLSGEPAWQPTGGKIDGALQFDGIDDYISTDFVLDPADGAFSVFAWIKGGAPYQVIISQADILAGRSIKPGSIWLCVDPLDGKLMTYCGLASAGSPIPPAPLLVSESVITDGQWHHVGFVWDGSYRSLYVDGIEAARDTAAQNPLQSATSGLRIGAGNYLEAGNFFSGLIDDISIYNMALDVEQIQEFAY